MPIPDMNGLPPWADFELTKSKVSEMVARYNNLLVNLDSQNVTKITSGTVIVYDLKGGSGTVSLTGDKGLVINNGTFDTFKADINGAVTMTSALVQSSIGYPKVELNSAQNLIAAMSDADTYMAITPSGPNSVPNLVFVDAGTTKTFMNRTVAGGTTLGTFDGEALNFQPAGGLRIGGQGTYSGSFSFVSSVNFGAQSTSSRTVFVNNGLITNVI